MSSRFTTAVENNDIPVIERCLDKETPRAIRQALITCCIEGNVTVAKCIIARRVIDVTSTDANSPLCLAAKYGNLQVVELFFEDVDILFSQEHLAHAITWAAEEGHLDIIQFLESRGGDIHYNNDWALCQAARFGQVVIVEYLLHNGANPCVHENLPVRSAPFGKSEKVLNLLLQRGVDVHANHEEALVNAASEGNVNMVKMLIAYGADVLYAFDRAVHQTLIYPTRGREEVYLYLQSIYV
jgi:ankyrin repeat protein